MLNKILFQENPYMKSYEMMHKKINGAVLALKENRPTKNFVACFYGKPFSDKRKYNKPACSEVATIFESSEIDILQFMDERVRLKT